MGNISLDLTESLSHPNKSLIVAASRARVAGEALCVTPNHVGGTQVPASPVVFDLRGAGLRALALRTEGSARIEFWRSANSPDPVNQAALDAGTSTIPDYSNVQWLFVSDLSVSDPGLHDVPENLLASLNRARYAKIDKTHGAPVTEVHAYGS